MMNIRKYRAGTTRDALELVKRDLGEDAFVLETKRVRSGGFLGLRSKTEVEVSAATGEALAGEQEIAEGSASAAGRSLNLKDDAAAVPSFASHMQENQDQNIDSALTSRATSAAAYEARSTGYAAEITKPGPETVEINPEAPKFVFPRKERAVSAVAAQTAVAPAESVAPAATDSEIQMLRAELREVKFSLSNLATLQKATLQRSGAVDLGFFGEAAAPGLNDAFTELIMSGVPADLARSFVLQLGSESWEGWDAADLAKATLLAGLSSAVGFESDVLGGEDRTILAVIGATGVGKTTTAAKLAARCALYDQKRVELVTLDTYRIAAVEQLKTYAEIIGAGCHVVRTVLELEAVLARLPQDAQVLIDTTGRNPHDLADQMEFSDFLKRRTDIRKCLVVQATTNSLDAVAAIRKFELYGADCLAITKIDETTRPGSVLEMITEGNLPLAYIGTGQRVPEDIQIATAESLANSILPVRH